MTSSLMNAGHIDALTGLRGVAALWVVLHHLVGTPFVMPYLSDDAVSARWWAPAGHTLRELAEKGWLGVDLFFVLSGFVISFAYREESRVFTWSGYAKFLKLRIARIYPTHLAMTFATAVVVIGAWMVARYEISEAFSLRKLLLSLALLNGWGFPDSLGWNFVSWSVSSEWLAYLCFPIVAAVALRIHGPRKNGAVIATIFVGLALLSHSLYGDRKYMFDAELTALRVLSEFMVGTLLHSIYVSRVRVSHSAWVATWAAGFVLVACSIPLAPRYDWMTIAAFALLVFGLSGSQGALAAFLSSRTMVYLGEISYSVYLVHALVITILYRLLERIAPVPSGVLVSLFVLFVIVGSLVGGHLLFTRVERPARQHLRARWAVPPKQRESVLNPAAG